MNKLYSIHFLLYFCTQTNILQFVWEFLCFFVCFLPPFYMFYFFLCWSHIVLGCCFIAFVIVRIVVVYVCILYISTLLKCTQCTQAGRQAQTHRQRDTYTTVYVSVAQLTSKNVHAFRNFVYYGVSSSNSSANSAIDVDRERERKRTAHAVGKRVREKICILGNTQCQNIYTMPKTTNNKNFTTLFYTYIYIYSVILDEKA